MEPVRAYLLGVPGEPDAAGLEERYFTDPDFLRQMNDSEQILIEDYLENRLSGLDRERFEGRYLVIPELTRRLGEVRAEHAPRWRPTLLRLALAAAALLAVGAGGWSLWQHSSPLLQGTARTGTPVQMAALEIRVSPGSVKGFGGGNGGKTGEFSIPPGTRQVRLVFELPGRSGALDLVVRLRKVNADGGRSLVWTSLPTRSGVAGTGGELKVLPDAGVLLPADYIAELVTTEGVVLESYAVRIR